MRKVLSKTLLYILFSGSSFTLYPQTKDRGAAPLTVYIFLSESCPICQSYTLPLKELHKKYKETNVKFVGLFPNYYSEADSIAAFKIRYDIPFDLLVDKNGEQAKRFNATITPQVFVESWEHKVLYSGRIDDSFYAIGKRRKVITSNDLDVALTFILNDKKLRSEKTQAVGCIISLEK